jgi:rubredoxin
LPDTHFFNVPLAVKYGQENSIILSNLCYWIKHNAQNNINFFEGRYWTYNTLVAFQKQFPYFTVNQIRTILSNLKKSGAVMTGNFNRVAFDRTLWYSVPDEVFSIYEGKAVSDAPAPVPAPGPASPAGGQAAPEPAGSADPESGVPICGNSQMHLGDPANAFVENHGPIPDKNKDIKQSTTTAAAAVKQDSPAVVAADSYINDLKAVFSGIDPLLLFDRGFYFKARSILEKYGLDNKYLGWLYDFCKKKNPDDLTAYYFKVFAEESLINRFIAAGTPPQEPRPQAAVCPVCGASHVRFSECPVCGFSSGHEKIDAARVIFNMPPDVRSAYESELAALIDVKAFDERLSLNKTIRRKYGIPE